MSQFSQEKKYARIILFIVIVALISAGCAAIFKGSSESVSFSSQPTGAEVYLNGQYVGLTPMQMNLKSNGNYNIEIRKEGFERYVFFNGHSVGAGWIILDVLLAGLIGIAVDAATGAWFYLDTDVVTATLQPLAGLQIQKSMDSAQKPVPAVTTSLQENAATEPGPQVEVKLRNGRVQKGELSATGESWVMVKIFLKNKDEFKELVIQKSEIESIYDVIQDRDVTSKYIK